MKNTNSSKDQDFTVQETTESLNADIAPTDPHLQAQPQHTDTSLVPVTQADAPPPAPKPTSEKPRVRGSFAGGTWIAMIVGALLLIFLLVFILQNQQEIELHLFAWSFTFPAGIGYLLAAITGALIMALVGGVRMIELRRQVKRQARNS